MSKKRPADNIHLAGLDELLGTDTEREAEITEIPLGKIRDFRNHPFRLTDDAELEKLSKSIQENGVLSPVNMRKSCGCWSASCFGEFIGSFTVQLISVPVIVSPEQLSVSFFLYFL